MTRITYRRDEDVEPRHVVEAVRRRRGGSLLKMDRVMLHSPTFTAAWNDFLSVVIDDLSVPVRERELIMCAVGVLNSADYEVASHGPKFLAAGGDQAQLDALQDLDSTGDVGADFTARDRTILRLTRALTREAYLSDEIFGEAEATVGGHQELVDLIGIISTYNMVSRFVTAFDIHADDGQL